MTDWPMFFRIWDPLLNRWADDSTKYLVAGRLKAPVGVSAIYRHTAEVSHFCGYHAPDREALWTGDVVFFSIQHSELNNKTKKLDTHFANYVGIVGFDKDTACFAIRAGNQNFPVCNDFVRIHNVFGSVITHPDLKQIVKACGGVYSAEVDLQLVSAVIAKDAKVPA